MKLNVIASALAVLALGLAPHAYGSTIFTATLTGSQEVPPTGSPGVGLETAVLNDAMTQLMVSLAFSGLEAGTTASHIHCCALPGTNAGVALPLTGFPTGVTSGTYAHTFTLATDLTGITPAAFTSALFAGTAYGNIHTTAFPNGEIRGQLAAIPEPGSFVLVFGALAALLLSSRRSAAHPPRR